MKSIVHSVIAVLLAAAFAAPAAAVENKTALETYTDALNAYMRGNWDAFADAMKSAEKTTGLSAQEKSDLAYMKKSAAEFRPAWWSSCRSTEKTSFPVKVWERPFVANFIPADADGHNANVDQKKRTVTITVSWSPSMVDDDRAGDLDPHHKYGFVRGDMGELAVWRRLGINYFLASLPYDTLLTMAKDNRMLLDQVQEFIACMTAAYYNTPRARLLLLQLLPQYLGKSGAEPLDRSCTAIGAMFLSEVLSEPAKWPSVLLPSTVPSKHVEEETIKHALVNIDPKWTLAEDRAFREIIRNFMTAKADSLLRNRGEITLSNKLTLKILAADDRDLVKKRDAWIAEKLKKRAQ